jgi:hypothetical protein
MNIKNRCSCTGFIFGITLNPIFTKNQENEK